MNSINMNMCLNRCHFSRGNSGRIRVRIRIRVWIRVWTRVRIRVRVKSPPATVNLHVTSLKYFWEDKLLAMN